MSTLNKLTAMLMMQAPLQAFPAEDQAAVAEFFVQHKSFEPMDAAKTAVSLGKVIKNLQEMNPEDVEAVFITVLVKSDYSEKCGHCDEDHYGTSQYLAFMGDVDTVEKVARHAITRSLAYAAGAGEDGMLILDDDVKTDRAVGGPGSVRPQ